MALDWILDKARPREGREVEYRALLSAWEKVPPGHPDRAALRPRLVEASVQVWDIIGCPRVGIDAIATTWFAESIYEPTRLEITVLDAANAEVGHGYRAYWSRPLKEIAAEHHGHPVAALAKVTKGFPTKPSAHAGPLDFPADAIGAAEWLPDELRRQAYEDHTAEAAMTYANLLERFRERSPQPQVAALEEPISWMRYWAQRGFGFSAWF